MQSYTDTLTSKTLISPCNDHPSNPKSNPNQSYFHTQYATPPTPQTNKQSKGKAPLSLNKSLHLLQKTLHRPPIQPKMSSLSNFHNFGSPPPMMLDMVKKSTIPPR